MNNMKLALTTVILYIIIGIPLICVGYYINPVFCGVAICLSAIMAAFFGPKFLIKVGNKVETIEENATYYQEITFKTLKKKMDDKSKKGESSIYLTETMGINMKKYMEDKGFIVKILYLGGTLIEW